MGLLLVAGVGCSTRSPEPAQDPMHDDPVEPSEGWQPPAVGPIDRDSDGFDELVDCDDLHPGIFPGAVETCDGFDQDSDGDIDEDAIDLVTAWPDADQDGYGADVTPTLVCGVPKGFVLVAGDCDDTDPARHPATPELCDGVDNDCDATTTEDHVVSVGGEAFATIQEAVDAANDGDIITACDGTYVENVFVPAFEELTLASLNGPATTILDGGGTGRGLSVQASAFTLSGWTIANGWCPANDRGGGLDADFTDVVVDDSVFLANACGFGGALAVYQGTLSITSTTFVDNSAIGGAAEGGAIWGFASELVIADSLFDGNSSRLSAGAVYSYENSLRVERTEFTGNQAPHGGAVLGGWRGAATEIVDCTFTDNAATDYGGAVNVYEDDTTITTSTFSGNSAANGGAMMLWGDTTVDTVTVVGNTASELGGGLFVFGDVDVVGSTIQENVAAVAGGGASLIFGQLRSTTTDWGVGTTDNVPEDVFDDGSGVAFDSDGTDFLCTAGSGC